MKRRTELFESIFMKPLLLPIGWRLVKTRYVHVLGGVIYCKTKNTQTINDLPLLLWKIFRRSQDIRQ